VLCSLIYFVNVNKKCIYAMTANNNTNIDRLIVKGMRCGDGSGSRYQLDLLDVHVVDFMMIFCNKLFSG